MRQREPDEAQAATTVAAGAEATAAAAQAAVSEGNDEEARALAEQASHQAADAMNAARQAAQESDDEAFHVVLADTARVVGVLNNLTTSPGDDYLAAPEVTADRRPLTRFMI